MLEKSMNKVRNRDGTSLEKVESSRVESGEKKSSRVESYSTRLDMFVRVESGLRNRDFWGETSNFALFSAFLLPNDFKIF